MKQEKKFFICCNGNATPGIAWCFPGDENCNNYCNHDHSKLMPDAPKSFDTIVWEEKDMWQDVLTAFSEYVPTAGGPSIFDILMEKYTITIKPSTI